jgi:hypothetical protein
VSYAELTKHVRAHQLAPANCIAFTKKTWDTATRANQLANQVMMNSIACKQGRCARRGCHVVFTGMGAGNLGMAQLAHRLPGQGAKNSATGHMGRAGHLEDVTNFAGNDILPAFPTWRKCEFMCSNCHHQYDKCPPLAGFFLIQGCGPGGKFE